MRNAGVAFDALSAAQLADAPEETRMRGYTTRAVEVRSFFDGTRRARAPACVHVFALFHISHARESTMSAWVDRNEGRGGRVFCLSTNHR